MRPRYLLYLCAAALLAFNALAMDQCPVAGPDAAPKSTQPGADCPKPDNTCDKKDENVGVISFLVGSHRMPTMHFIDFVEIFMR